MKVKKPEQVGMELTFDELDMVIGGMEYTKGPKLNIKAGNETNRDNLGINGAQTTIQDLLCPVINTVTYRAFYWIFLVWNYYDFFMHSGKKNFSSKETTDDFLYNYLRKHDYFFVLSNIIAKNEDQRNLVGITAATEDSKGTGPYSASGLTTNC